MSGVVRIEIVETPEELKDLMRQEKDAVRQEKLLVLYWLKTKMVDSVLSAAVRLGKHRTTIQRWLSSYRTGGIAELLSSEASLGNAQNHEGRNCRETRKRIESTRTIQQLQRSASMVDKLLRCSCSISDSTSMDKISASRKIKSATSGE